MNKLKVLIISFFCVLLAGCSLLQTNNVINTIKPNKESFYYNGTWSIERVYDLIDGELYTEEYKQSIISKELQISYDKIKILDTTRSNVKYKLKVVDKNYIISYERNLTAKEFLGDKKSMDIISVIDNNAIFCEFFTLDNGKIVMLYKSLIMILNKISDETNFVLEDNNIISNGNVIYDILDEDVGLMLGIKKPRQIQEDGSYSKEEYRTLWIAYKDGEIQPVYEKKNIIFPRLNGILMLSKKNATSKNNNYIEYFEIANLDGKVISTMDFKSDTNSYKSIKFVGNDYLSLEKYEGNNFNNKYNKYQIVPVDNVNTSKGIRIDEIYSSDLKVIFDNDRKEALENIPTEIINMLQPTIDYSNITMDRNEGKWVLKGKISPKDNIGEGVDFNLSAKPNNKLINFNSLFVPWKNLIGDVLFLEDAFTSPNNSIAIIQFKKFIVIYKIEDGSLKGSPILDIPINENEEIIMAEWCNADYISQWQNAFKDGNVIVK